MLNSTTGINYAQNATQADLMQTKAYKRYRERVQAEFHQPMSQILRPGVDGAVERYMQYQAKLKEINKEFQENARMEIEEMMLKQAKDTAKKSAQTTPFGTFVRVENQEVKGDNLYTPNHTKKERAQINVEYNKLVEDLVELRHKDISNLSDEKKVAHQVKLATLEDAYKAFNVLTSGHNIDDADFEGFDKGIQEAKAAIKEYYQLKYGEKLEKLDKNPIAKGAYDALNKDFNVPKKPVQKAETPKEDTTDATTPEFGKLTAEGRTTQVDEPESAMAAKRRTLEEQKQKIQKENEANAKKLAENFVRSQNGEIGLVKPDMNLETIQELAKRAAISAKNGYPVKIGDKEITLEDLNAILEKAQEKKYNDIAKTRLDAIKDKSNSQQNKEIARWNNKILEAFLNSDVQNLKTIVDDDHLNDSISNDDAYNTLIQSLKSYIATLAQDKDMFADRPSEYELSGDVDKDAQELLYLRSKYLDLKDIED